VSAPTCFGIGVPSSGSPLNEGTQLQHANPGIDRLTVVIKILKYYNP